MERTQTAVCIVGGGPVGLAMALLLDRHGVNTVLLEQNQQTTTHPKARGLFSRSMEMLRQLGIEERVRRRGLPEDADTTLVVESLVGMVYGQVRAEPDPHLSPSWKAVVAQDAVEEELFEALRAAPKADVRFGVRFEKFVEAEETVVVHGRDTFGNDVVVECTYLMAADGAASMVRDQAGISMLGEHTLAVYANDYWRADLSALPITRTHIGFQTIPSDGSPPSVILNTNGTDRWLTLTRLELRDGERWTPWTDDELVEIIRTQVGLPDLQPEILGRTIWRMASQVAESYRSSRIFLVGDAAHRIPPTGGFGLNTGLQDVHNLAWKLALVLRGEADERLLDTYEVERKPIAESNARWSEGNSPRWPHLVAAVRSGNQDRIDFWIEDLENHFHNVGRALGFCYDTGAVIPDGTVPIPLVSRTYTPSDRPGGRFPHVWLDDDRTRTTIDWFDTTFVLVTGSEAAPWKEAVQAVPARDAGLVVHRELPGIGDTEGFHVSERGALLVRPDGHVAWRAPWLPDDPSAELDRVLDQLLH